MRNLFCLWKDRGTHDIFRAFGRAIFGFERDVNFLVENRGKHFVRKLGHLILF